MLPRAIAGATGLLVLFHAWLFGSQLWDGELARPELVMRWAIAAGLVVSLLALRSSGASMFLGRKAISVWLLAALLHGPAMAGQHEGGDWPALPEAITAVVQIAAASVMLGLSFALLAAFRRRLHGTSPAWHRTSPIRTFEARDLHRLVRVAPRPPPTHA